ncbi:MAG: NERD domain-containing protein [Chloroflexi bacterium]|nr:NERD domain-containing protein [Chloroflexota bacterium]
MFFASLGVLILGFLVTSQPLAESEEDVNLVLALLPALVLPTAVVMTMVSVRMTNLWVRPPRPEEVIAQGLKGISNKSVLYSYYHFPARHVLIAPQGVFAIVTRFQDGRIFNEGDRWRVRKNPLVRLLSVFRLDNVGNPTFDALRAAQILQAKLAPIAPDIEVQPLIVFVDPRVQLQVNEPTVPVLHADPKHTPNLKTYFRDAAREKRPTLTPEQITAFEEATLP